MQTDRDAAAAIEQRADFLRQETGKRSWASIIRDSNQFLCSYCNRPFDPDEAQTAHHFARRCIGMDGAVPAYKGGDACPVRMNGTAV